jgi:hypothetical protein
MVKDSYPIHTFNNWIEDKAGLGTGIGGIASLAFYYNQLPVDLTNDIEQVLGP